MMPKKSDVVIIYSWVSKHLKFSSSHRLNTKKCRTSLPIFIRLQRWYQVEKIEKFSHSIRNEHELLMFFMNDSATQKDVRRVFFPTDDDITWTKQKEGEFSHVFHVRRFFRFVNFCQRQEYEILFTWLELVYVKLSC